MKKLSPAVICVVVLVFLVGFSDPALAAPGITVIPDQYYFGEEEIGSSSSTQIEISNDWSGDLAIESITLLQTGLDFFIISPPPPGTVVPPDSSVLMGVAYSPTSQGLHTTTLEIRWANGEAGTSYVEFTGVGVDATGGPVTIDDILAFFDASIEDRTLLGVGPGNSDEAHISVMRHVLRLVAKLISKDKAGVACKHLEFVHDRCDEDFPPPDFVEGPAASTLAEMIEALMTEIGCQ